MYHSITFGEKNTWDDWRLIPKTRPLFQPPEPKTSLVEVPGSSLTLDLSTTLAGQPTYKNRTGSFDFYVTNGFRNWAELYSEILEYLHGQRLHAVLEDDPEYYYEGLFSVNNWRSDQQRSMIVIDYTVSPYKYGISTVDEDWVWSYGDFSNGSVRWYKNREVNGQLSLTVQGYRNAAPLVIFASTEGLTVTWNETVYSLLPGANVLPAIVLQNGDNVLLFHGTGFISVQIIGGRL